MFASQAISHGCPVVLTCFITASINASFLGVQPSECLQFSAKTRIPPLTFTHAWAILPSFPGIDVTAPSSVPTTAPRLLSIATKTPPDVCLRSSLLAFSSVIPTASAAHPSFFLILSSTPKKISKASLYLLTYFFSVFHAETFSEVHLTIFESFCI